MNITYWLVVSVLFAITFLIIIPPLWKKREIKDTNSEQRNVRIAKDRLTDLKQQLQAGVLTQQQFDEQYEELELNLGDDLSNEHQREQSTSQGRWVIPIIVICIPLISVLTYFKIGEPEALKKAKWQQSQQTANPTQEDINAMVNGLAQRLKQEPENAQGWLMLGRSYKVLQKFELAAKAFEQAYVLLGDQTEVMLHYADSLAMVNRGRLSGKAAELIFKALEQAPDNVMALWLGGMAKAEMGENAKAMQHWRKLETILPPDSDSLKELQGMMASISSEQGSAPGVPEIKQAKVKPEESKVVVPGSTVSIDVQVSVAKEIGAKVNKTDTVFIYAKALTGPPMPLAIVRKKVADLPVSVTLNDAMAMMATMKLSNFKQVKVMARISKSGTAMQQKGDYIGALEVKNMTGKMSVVISINEEIK